MMSTPRPSRNSIKIVGSSGGSTTILWCPCLVTKLSTIIHVDRRLDHVPGVTPDLKRVITKFLACSRGILIPPRVVGRCRERASCTIGSNHVAVVIGPSVVVIGRSVVVIGRSVVLLWGIVLFVGVPLLPGAHQLVVPVLVLSVPTFLSTEVFAHRFFLGGACVRKTCIFLSGLVWCGGAVSLRVTRCATGFVSALRTTLCWLSLFGGCVNLLVGGFRLKRSHKRFACG